MDQKTVSGALRRSFWPALREYGFLTRTDRVAWRHAGGHADVVELSTLGSHADSVGGTPVSLGVIVASWPAWLERSVLVPEKSVPLRRGLPAPHYWHCDPLAKELHKTLSQPWFKPFTRPPGPNVPRSFQLHREALMHVFRRDTHDRPDVWYVLEDASNLDEVIGDLVRVISTVGMAFLEACHDPVAVIRMVESGDLMSRPDSPAARRLTEQARRALGFR